MDIELPPGKYVVAVSGGVDSMVLLHLLQERQHQAKDKVWRLTVAHFDHGVRPDSAADRQLVQTTARRYGLPFVYSEGGLGPGVSEAAARKARYAFLEQVLGASGGRAIVMAHHQDDLLETAILNILRGTGRKGLTALGSRPGIIRPLLHTPKHDLVVYARERNLSWHEDSTNQDITYLRNYIRHRLMPRFGVADREHLSQIIDQLQVINRELDALLANELHLQSVTGTIDRQWFNQLPHALAREVMATWLRAHGERGFDSRALERLVVNAKVAGPGRHFSLPGDHQLRIGREHLALVTAER